MLQLFVGLWHEHQRPDRDTALIIHEDRAQPSERSNFLKLNDVVLNTLGKPHDYASLEHYDSFVRKHFKTGSPIHPGSLVFQWYALEISEKQYGSQS